MIYFWAVILHFIGDYIIQSNWMANEKVNRWLPAWIHGITYALPFLILTRSVPALLVICVSHVIIDHYRLAKHFIWVKNFLAPRSYPQPEWAEATRNGGFPLSTPPWMAIWLMIIVDNTVHVLINFGALTWLV